MMRMAIGIVKQVQPQVVEKRRVLVLEVVNAVADHQVGVGSDHDQVARRLSLDSVDKFEKFFEKLRFALNLVRSMV